jgi:hypothetical protein
VTPVAQRKAVIPANAGIQFGPAWTPAFAGVTSEGSVIPANAGILARRPTLDSGFRRNDDE